MPDSYERHLMVDIYVDTFSCWLPVGSSTFILFVGVLSTRPGCCARTLDLRRHVSLETITRAGTLLGKVTI